MEDINKLIDQGKENGWYVESVKTVNSFTTRPYLGGHLALDRGTGRFEVVAGAYVHVFEGPEGSVARMLSRFFKD